MPLRNPPEPEILPSNQLPTRKRVNQNRQRPRPPLFYQLHPPIWQYRRHRHDAPRRCVGPVGALADASVHDADVADSFEVGFCVGGGLRFVVMGPGAEFFEGGGVGAGEEGGLVVHVGFAVEDAGGGEMVPACEGGPVTDLGSC